MLLARAARVRVRSPATATDAVMRGLLRRPARVEEMTKLCRTGSLKLRKNLGRMGLGS